MKQPTSAGVPRRGLKAGGKLSILGTADVCVFPWTNPEEKITESELANLCIPKAHSLGRCRRRSAVCRWTDGYRTSVLAVV